MKDYRVYLAQILERIERIEEFTKEGKESSLANNLTQDAVIRNFEVIGEATKGLPLDFISQNPGIPWRRAFAESEDVREKLADEALEEKRKGKTTPLDLGRL